MRESIQELVYLLKAKTKCIWIKTYEEAAVIGSIKSMMSEEFPAMKLFSWSFFDGLTKEPLTDFERKEAPERGVSPDRLFDLIIQKQAAQSPKDENIYIIKDFHTLNSTPLFIRGLRDAKEKNPKDVNSYNPIIVVSPVIDIALEHQKLFTILEYEVPSKKEIEVLMSSFVKKMRTSNKGYELPTGDTVKQCIDLAYGLTLEEIKNLVARSLFKYNTISITIFHEARLEYIKKTDVLEYKTATMSLSDMGGNEAFKNWIDDVKMAMTKEAEDFGVEKPKGFLGLGVPGTSKTLSSEIIASELNLPLLKLNMSKIMHSHVGQSEKNIENVIDVIRACSPCVLLIDEAEKTLSGM